MQCTSSAVLSRHSIILKISFLRLVEIKLMAPGGERGCEKAYIFVKIIK